MRRTKPGRWVVAVLLEMVLETTWRGSTVKPAAAISRIWFSVVCPVVETRAAGADARHQSETIQKIGPKHHFPSKLSQTNFRTKLPPVSAPAWFWAACRPRNRHSCCMRVGCSSFFSRALIALREKGWPCQKWRNSECSNTSLISSIKASGPAFRICVQSMSAMPASTPSFPVRLSL